MKRYRGFRFLNIALGLIVLASMLLPAAAAAPPPPPEDAFVKAATALGYNSGEVSVIPSGATEVPDEIIVGLKAQVNTAGVQSLSAKHGGRLMASIDALNVHLVKLGKGADKAKAMQALRADPAVKFVEPNGVYQITDEGGTQAIYPNDPMRGSQWALAKEKAYDAWSYTRGSSAVLVAVVDTGIDRLHPDLDGKYAGGYDFANNDTDPMDDNNHGTHVAGKIAAETNNGVGIAGLSWYSRLLAAKVCTAAGSCSWFNVARGIVYSAALGAKVINLSLGGSSPSTILQLAGQFAYNQLRALLVASSGNSGINQANYPAAYPEFISVACTTQTDARCYFSTYHSTVELSAPGYQIFSTIRRNQGSPLGYGYMSGTSMSAPDVSGIAALVAARFPTKTNAQLRACLRVGVDDKGPAGRDIYFGYGRVNALKAVQCGGSGTVQGYVRNATNNAAIAGAVVRHNASGRTVTTNSSGFYRMTNVPSGSQSFTASKTGFISLTQSASVPSGGTVNRDFSLSPVLAAGQWRIVLTWNANPRDLDSHLWLPPGSPNYHLYYANRGNCVNTTTFPRACLDRDDVDGYGPETITIFGPYAGTYRYAVRWYSGTGTWATSGARVVVYRGSTLVANRLVPASATNYNWWYLMNFNAQSGAITWVNLVQSASPAPYSVKADAAMAKPYKM